MSKGIYFVSGLLLGGLTGFVSSKALLKGKLEAKNLQDIQSVKETYRDVVSGLEDENRRLKGEDTVKAPQEKRAEAIVKAKGFAATNNQKPDISNFVNYSNILNGYKGESKPIGRDTIRVISPEEFAADEEYEQISLTWYSDGVLVDDNNHQMSETEIAHSVGIDFMNHFGEYESDSVFIRNDEKKCDYEILSDTRKYSDVLEDHPYLKE